MRKLLSLFLCFIMILPLTSCQRAEDVIDHQEEGTEVITTDALGENYYPILSTPSKTPSRETFYTSVTNFDFKSIGRGLQLYCLDYFSKDEYFLQEGQFLTDTRLRELLRRNSELYPYSIQPEKGSYTEGYLDAIMASSLFEQDFLKRENGEYVLKAVAFSIVVSPRDASNQEVNMSEETIHEYSQEATRKLYTYLKTIDELKEIPILIMVYQASSNTDIYGGHYIAKTYCNDSLGEYQKVDDRYIIFTSSEAEDYDQTTYNEFASFKQLLKEYSLYDAIGVVGYVHYRNGNIESMVINVRANVKTYTELITILNVIADDLNTRFTKSFDIRVKVESQDDFEAVVIKHASSKSKIELFY